MQILRQPVDPGETDRHRTPTALVNIPGMPRVLEPLLGIGAVFDDLRVLLGGHQRKDLLRPDILAPVVIAHLAQPREKLGVFGFCFVPALSDRSRHPRID